MFSDYKFTRPFIEKIVDKHNLSMYNCQGVARLGKICLILAKIYMSFHL